MFFEVEPPPPLPPPRESCKKKMNTIGISYITVKMSIFNNIFALLNFHYNCLLGHYVEIMYC